MPSRFEPCGLNQMVAMRYGCVPVVRAVGGLADTVTDYDPGTGEGNGLAFRPYDAMALYHGALCGQSRPTGIATSGVCCPRAA